MNYKYSLNEIVYVKHIVDSEAEVVDQISKPGVKLYQLKISTGKYKDKLFWFAEHEVHKKS